MGGAPGSALRNAVMANSSVPKKASMAISLVRRENRTETAMPMTATMRIQVSATEK